LRRGEPAFHPDGGQDPVDLGDPALLAFVRTSPDGQHAMLVVANFSGTTRSLPRETVETTCGASLDGPERSGLATDSPSSASLTLGAFELGWFPVRAADAPSRAPLLAHT
jgi:hypothetical protein